MTHFRKMYIAAEIINNHVIPNTKIMYYSEGEAESYLIKELQKDGTKVFLIIPHCAMHFGEESDYIKMKNRITKEYATK